MLQFDETKRPTFSELSEAFVIPPSEGSGVVQLKRQEEDPEPESDPVPEELPSKKPLESLPEPKQENKLELEESTEPLMSQQDLFKEYSKSNNLFLPQCNSMYWFEFGGPLIAHFDMSQPESKWRNIGKYKACFSSHFVIVVVPKDELYLLGPNSVSSCLLYQNKHLLPKQGMLQEKSFFAGIHLKEKIYTFGGYDIQEKQQLKSCEIYDVTRDHWTANKANLNEDRSQCAVCIMDLTTIYIFGGYNKTNGTLASIEKYSISSEKFTLLSIVLPVPLRRFGAIKIAPQKILLLGGIQKLSKESDAVYCVDFEENQTIERLDKLEKGGVIEYPIAADSVGTIHLFVENCSGTAAPHHSTYTFLEYS